MTNLIFYWYLLIGTIAHNPHQDDDRCTYTINGINVEYAYKGEILQYIETGKFHYNEDFKD
jgi:hypothetical protein